MREMKERFRLFKLICKEISDYNPKLWGWLIANTIIKVILPFAQLLLSAQVIRWLMEGMAVNEYLIQLSIWVGGIAVLGVTEYLLMRYIDVEHEFFRIHMMYKIMNQLNRLDYPLIISEKGQKNFSESVSLTGYSMSLFGRFLREFNGLLSSILAVIMYLYLIFQVEPLFLLIIILLIIGLSVFKKYQKRLAPIINERQANVEKKIKYLRGLYGDTRITKDVRLYQMVDWFKEINHEVTDKFRENLIPKNKLTVLENMFLSTGMILLTGLAYVRSIQMILGGQLEVADFVVYVGAVTLLASTATQFVNHLATLDQDLLELEYYDNFMNQEAVFNHGDGPKIPNSDVEIELRNVTYTYPGNEKPTLKNLNIRFKPSEKVAIVGENGAGKTTLIKLVTGLLLPDEGEILINGIPQTEFNIHEYYRLFSTVFQDTFLFTYTIKETILQGIPYDEDHYQTVLEQSGMEQIIDRFPDGDETKIVRKVYQESVQLSGGQMQKLKLAQALYKDAFVLILDEPTAALDPIAEHEVYQDYLKFSEDKLSLFISHRLSSTRFCDRIIYIKQGEITEIGTHEELLADKKDYYRLFEAQAYYYRENLQEVEEPEIETGGVI